MRHIKDGAKVEGLKPVMLNALIVMAVIFSKHGVDMVVTEGTGGVHKVNSLHYRGYAVDLRSHQLVLVQQALVLAEIKEQLGPDFDCILEGDHYHIEYDPQHNGGKDLP